MRLLYSVPPKILSKPRAPITKGAPVFCIGIVSFDVSAPELLLLLFDVDIKVYEFSAGVGPLSRIPPSKIALVVIFPVESTLTGMKSFTVFFGPNGPVT